MRLKFPKLGFSSRLSKMEPSSCCDVSEEPRKRRDVQVPTLTWMLVLKKNVATWRSEVSTS